MNNDYCQMLNDGFGCGIYAETKDHRQCLNCLVHVLAEIAEDIKKLSNEVDDYELDIK